MQASRALAAALLLAGAAPAVEAARARAGAGGNPIAKAIELLNDLTAKVEKGGAAEDRAFRKFMDWCGDVEEDANRTIKAVSARKAKLEAEISKLDADIEASTMKIEELGSASASGEADLKKATELRKREASDFLAAEKELIETIDTLERASKIIEREAERNPSASLLQLGGAQLESVLQSLTAVVNAASFSNADRQKLLALVQDGAGSSSDDGDLGAPAAAAYEGHSKNILDLLEDLREKAETQLGDLRRAEEKANHEYKMLKQSLEDGNGASAKDMTDKKSEKAADEQARASAEGDLIVAAKELKHEEESLAMTQSSCQQASADHEASLKSRAEELAAITQATQALQGAAADAAPTLLQLGAGASSASAAGKKAAELLRHLARRQHSAALAQLASHVSVMLRYGARTGEDPFAKVRGLIEGMITKLQTEAGNEATEKAFCDSEIAKTEAKKGELTDDTSKLAIKIEQAVAKTASLKEEVKDLQVELSSLAKAQAVMDRIHQEGQANYVELKATLEDGLAGVRKALSILRDYYANEAGSQALEDGVNIGDVMRNWPEVPLTHQKSTGAGSVIIGLLETVESRMADSLAKEDAQMTDLQAEYEQTTQDNTVAKTSKDKDVAYKTKEIKSLEKEATELSSSKDEADAELAAVTEYYERLQGRCVAKPKTYEERKRRREVEIAGLKEALSVLEDEASFLQRKRRGSGRRHGRSSSGALR